VAGVAVGNAIGSAGDEATAGSARGAWDMQHVVQQW
jgi:hypothetical protein